MVTPEQLAWQGRLKAAQRKVEIATGQALDERDTVIVQCWREKALSYKGISDATGLSKSRVIQIVRAARGK